MNRSSRIRISGNHGIFRALLLVVVASSGLGPGAWTTAFAPGRVVVPPPRHTRRTIGSVRPLLAANPQSSTEKLDLNILVIDHYDSFTYNLVDLLGQYCVQPPLVLAADTDPRDVQRLLQQHRIDGIVLSPGPGNPDNCGTLAASLVATQPDTPILGVCLGHQILGTYYGATCTAAPTPVHGQVQALEFLDAMQHDDLWQRALALVESQNGNATTLWDVTRYHSLHVTQLEQSPLIPVAQTADKVIMAFHHPTLPHYGVQFHPESVGSQHGWALLKAFCSICQETKDVARSYRVDTKAFPMTTRTVLDTNPLNGSHNATTRVYVYKVPNTSMQPLDVMTHLLSDCNYRFWLDTADERAHAMSVLGAATERVEYWGQEASKERRGVYLYQGDNAVHYPELDILTYLQGEYASPTQTVTMVDTNANGQLEISDTVDDTVDTLNFSYRGGHVGFLGYEVRHDTADFLAAMEGGQSRSSRNIKPYSESSTPTAAFMKAERSFVYSHDDSQWYLVGTISGDDSSATNDMLVWMQEQSRAMQGFEHIRTDKRNGKTIGRKPAVSKPVAFSPSRSKCTYHRNFQTCLDKIRQGDSYELCLTNQLEAIVKTKATPFDLYRILRRRNPAPFASFFDWNSQQRPLSNGSSFAVCCTSPERFVSVRPGPENTMRVEAKPIKGTCARVLPQPGRGYRSISEECEDQRRAEELRGSVKNRAENLMIVDLLRNDLSRVCQTGSVHVAKLMDIESFATVHQMVSTIRGTLDTPNNSAVSTLRACFPGGSMTGAPKLRTMEILDDLEEGRPRGPYSGCLGYLSPNGAMDMNIVIRTAVVTPVVGQSYQVSVGAGGAITILSESEDEYDEMILKASAIMSAVGEWTQGEIVEDNNLPLPVMQSVVPEVSAESKGTSCP